MVYLEELCTQLWVDWVINLISCLYLEMLFSVCMMQNNLLQRVKCGELEQDIF